jgi:DNA-binding MarR family transcriptional regulator
LEGDLQLTPASLAAAMCMTRGAVSKVLEKLETQKLVSRTTSLLESRVPLLSLTAQARRILPSLTEIVDIRPAKTAGVFKPAKAVCWFMLETDYSGC